MKPAQDDNWLKQSPYDRFLYFIALKVDRFKALSLTIEKLGLNSIAVSVSGNRHILIFPPGIKNLNSKNGFPFAGQNPFLLTAHYDRVAGSPGANDNSIAVFHLLHVAMLLAQLNIDKWIIIFTDKEELKPGENFEIQGSFTLALKLKSWGLDKARIFNFDACGTGDTFIFSTITDSVLRNSENQSVAKLKNDIQQLRNHVLKTADNLRFDKVLLAPTPFCDDMGFLRAGFAAQTITMLPSEEAAQYEEVLRKYPDFARLIISGEIKKAAERRFLPATWRNLNTPADTHNRLTPQFFDQVVGFIVELCK
ncbi:MAG: Zn-dependent exopeptidase M28 [Treponema sp.]|jgi:hypothetical protein|nr:Zn-dependent exopeptidase M28 [Treponema sp.]